MKWNIEVPAPELSWSINHSSHISFLGSCFSTEMAKYLKKSGFHVLGNPLGIVFNPVSLCSALSGKNLGKEFTIERPDGVRHLLCHGSITAESDKEMVKHLHDVRSAFLQQLNKSKLLIVTWG
ncbi:MAG: GSCFA domain-containing protein, partial [Flavobacteriales bacterium]|nr:GSCFA domain-containing protein [Flavobacteriales bacterium]